MSFPISSHPEIEDNSFVTEILDSLKRIHHSEGNVAISPFSSMDDYLQVVSEVEALKELNLVLGS